MRVKICGITKSDQAQAIAKLGATALGFICVTRSPRYISPGEIRAIGQQLPSELDQIGVFANSPIEQIVEVVRHTPLTGVQLHGEESPAFCDQLRQALPGTEIIKAFRLKTPDILDHITAYSDVIDALLLDAYHPEQLGGTGQTLNWESLSDFAFPCPWFLAGGLTPDNIKVALHHLHPHGIDLSSGVEIAPGDKDLTKVSRLFQQLAEV